VAIEPGCLGAFVDGLLLGDSPKHRQSAILPPFFLSELPRDLIAGYPKSADIEQNELRQAQPCRFEDLGPLWAVRRQRSAVASRRGACSSSFAVSKEVRQPAFIIRGWELSGAIGEAVAPTERLRDRVHHGHARREIGRLSRSSMPGVSGEGFR
jgi:hypothetical protein